MNLFDTCQDQELPRLIEKIPFMSLAATTKKLGVSFYAYLRDRVSGANQVPALADLITQQAERHRLDASWKAS